MDLERGLISHASCKDITYMYSAQFLPTVSSDVVLHEAPVTFQWNRAIMINFPDKNFNCDYTGRSVHRSFTEAGITVGYWLHPANVPNKAEIRAIIREIKIRGRSK